MKIPVKQTFQYQVNFIHELAIELNISEQKLIKAITKVQEKLNGKV